MLFAVALGMIVDVIVQPDFLGLDFPSFFSACRGAQNRVDIYDVGVLAQLAKQDGIHAPFPYLYPPVFAYLFQWMAWLDPRLAQRLWVLGTALAFCAVSLGAAIGVRGQPRLTSSAEPLPWPLAVIFSLCLAWALSLHNVVSAGQINFFVLALMLPAVMWRAGARQPAACALALAILIKTTPALFLVIFVVQGRMRLVRRTCGWMAVIIALSLLLGAGPAWIVYLRLLPQLAPGQSIPGLFPPEAVWNFSLAGLMARLSADPARARWLATLASLALLAGLLAAARLARFSRDGQRGVLLSACALMIAAAPLSYVHHAVFLFPALFGFLAEDWEQPRTIIPAVLALGMLVATDLPSVYGRWGLSPEQWRWISSINLYALLALYAVGVQRAIAAAGRPGLVFEQPA